MRGSDEFEQEGETDRRVVAMIEFSFPSRIGIGRKRATRLPLALRSELRWFARGKLTRSELMDLTARIASNDAALEILAREIKTVWSVVRKSDDLPERSR